MPYVRSLTLALALLAPAAQSQEMAQDWATNCEAERCTMSRGLKDVARDRLIATFLVSVPKADTGATLGIAVALGAALAPGARIYAGETEYELSFEVCFPDGCRAVRPFNADELALIGAAPEVEIRFFPYGTDTPVSIKMPFAGFAEAIAAARQTLAGAP